MSAPSSFSSVDRRTGSGARRDRHRRSQPRPDCERRGHHRRPAWIRADRTRRQIRVGAARRASSRGRGHLARRSRLAADTRDDARQSGQDDTSRRTGRRRIRGCHRHGPGDRRVRRLIDVAADGRRHQHSASHDRRRDARERSRRQRDLGGPIGNAGDSRPRPRPDLDHGRWQPRVQRAPRRSERVVPGSGHRRTRGGRARPGIGRIRIRCDGRRDRGANPAARLHSAAAGAIRGHTWRRIPGSQRRSGSHDGLRARRRSRGRARPGLRQLRLAGRSGAELRLARSRRQAAMGARHDVRRVVGRMADRPQSGHRTSPQRRRHRPGNVSGRRLPSADHVLRTSIAGRVRSASARWSRGIGASADQPGSTAGAGAASKPRTGRGPIA